jgi:cell division protein FtsB
MYRAQMWPWLESVLHQKQSRLILVGGVGCFLLLSLLAMVGERGFWELYKYSYHLQRIESRVRTLEVENQRLQRQVTGLRSDPYQVEKLAREDLGLARPDEVIFEIVDRPLPDISWPRGQRQEERGNPVGKAGR